MIKIAFFIPETCQLLDLSGPLQAFYEANKYGADYQLEYYSNTEQINSSQMLQLNGLKHFSDSKLNKGDFIIIPGIDGEQLKKEFLANLGNDFYQWLRTENAKGVIVCSVCNAAFILAYADLLNGKSCTTHWERFQQLQRDYPQIKVIQNRLFVKDETVYTSAGISSGIDLALDIINDHYGAHLTSKVAKEMVIYIRRDGSYEQFSIFLDYRNHLNEKVHLVQDRIIQKVSENFSVDDLADFVHVSPRHLSRIFKKETGITIKEFSHRIKLETAKEYFNNQNLNLEEIAYKSGFQSGQHFRRVWKSYYKTAPSLNR